MIYSYSEEIFIKNIYYLQRVIWSSDTVQFGILYKDMHKLLPDESQYFLDGYVLDSIRINIGKVCLFKSSLFSFLIRITCIKPIASLP